MADVGYCERDDVRRVLREASFNSDLGQEPEIVDEAIIGQTEWLRRRTSRHWYDSSGSTTLVPTSLRSVSDIRLDVPSGPHRQDRQLLNHKRGVEYPTTNDGRYAKIRLPHYDVDTITALKVRDLGSGVTDWTTASDKVSGRGEDYYLQTSGDDTGASHLYIRADSIGARVNFDNLLTLAYDYGRDGVPESVRRATALLAAEELVLDEDTQTNIPDNGQFVNVETKADQFHRRAMSKLDPWLETPIA